MSKSLFRGDLIKMWVKIKESDSQDKNGEYSVVATMATEEEENWAERHKNTDPSESLEICFPDFMIRVLNREVSENE